MYRNLGNSYILQTHRRPQEVLKTKWHLQNQHLAPLEPALKENVSSYSLEKSITFPSEFLGDPSGVASHSESPEKVHLLPLLLGLLHPLLVPTLKEQAGKEMLADLPCEAPACPEDASGLENTAPAGV